jgi:three-Cys-motif partner protein
VKHLEKLIASQGDTKPKRFVHLFPGDANVNVPQFLADKPIKSKEATFCLLDQRTFECDWATVTALAKHKSDGNKIELFYFLAQGWIDRAISGLRKEKQARMVKWWGNTDWRDFTKVHFTERGRQLAERFKKEFNYRFAYSYPIYERDKKGGKTMFWMTHASDHPEAPKLMVRAYNNVIAPLETIEQLTFEFGGCAP